MVVAIEAALVVYTASAPLGENRVRALGVLAVAVGATVLWIARALAATVAVDGAESARRPYATARPAQVWRLATVPRQTWWGLSLVLGLWFIFMRYTRWPSVAKKTQLENILATQNTPNTFGEFVSREGVPYWLQWIPMGINLNENNAMGMAFAFLIGGAVAALVLPPGFAGRLTRATGMKGALAGGLLGAPLMMCSACSVPVAVGWRQRGSRLETALGVVGGSALLNVAGLATIWALFPAPIAWGRIVASLTLVLVVTPAVAWFVQRGSATTQTGTSPAIVPIAVSTPVPPPSWLVAAGAAVRDSWRHSTYIAYRLFVPMVVGTFLAAFARLLISPDAASQYLGGGWVAVVIVAAVGTLLAIPTLFEIPLVMGLMALGMGEGPAAALLITAPSMSLVTWFMLRKETGNLAPALLLVSTFVIGTAVGLLAQGIGP